MNVALVSPEGEAVLADLLSLVTSGVLTGATATLVTDLVTISGQAGTLSGPLLHHNAQGDIAYSVC